MLENGITLLLVRFSEAVDRRRPAEVAAQFLEDGIFKPGETAISGSAAIEAHYRNRLADERRTTRHLWSNLRVHPCGETETRLDAILTIYAFEPLVSETDVQLRIGDVQGRCVRDAQGVWRFAEHLFKRAFTLRLPVSP